MITTALLLVAPFWVAAYIVAGWTGVAFMAAMGVLGEGLILLDDERHARRQAAIARQRWSRWHD